MVLIMIIMVFFYVSYDLLIGIKSIIIICMKIDFVEGGKPKYRKIYL